MASTTSQIPTNPDIDQGLDDSQFQDPQLDQPVDGDQGQLQVQDGQGGTPPQPTDDPLKGTPFKDVAGIVKGYKDIQRLISAKDEKLKQLELVVNSLLGGRQPEGTPPAKQFDAAAWFQKFAIDPQAALMEILGSNMGNLLKEQGILPRLEGVEANTRQSAIVTEVQEFVSRNPEITEKDEDEILEYLKENPKLMEFPDKLDIAWDRITAQRAREQRQQTRQVDAVKDAKAAAGIGGKPATANTQGGDEFDDVLESDKALRSLYSR